VDSARRRRPRPRPHAPASRVSWRSRISAARWLWWPK
jgi:hypothetical protein